MQLDLPIFLNLLLIGLFQGAIYSLISMGLTLIFGTVKIVNFAHGDFLMLSGYFVFWIWAILGVDPLLALPVVFSALFCIGYVTERVLIKRVLGRPTHIQMLMTLGLSLVIQNSVIVLWKADPRYVHTSYADLRLEFGAVAVPFPRLLSFILAMVFALTLHLFLLKTTYGTAIRGTGQDQEAAHLMGINVNKIYSLSFGLGISCTAVAATLLSTYFPLSPFLGASFMVITFIVIILGGLGNYLGAFTAGLILGTIEVFTAYMLSPLLRQTIPLLIFILVLLLKPEGLFGRELRR